MSSRVMDAKPLRPQVMSTQGMVAAGHYLAASAGFRMLAVGGNAVDAGVAAGLALNTVHTDMTTLSGVAPIILYLAEERRVVTIAGIGRWPAAATLELFRDRLGGIPEWPLNCVVPAAADAWLSALEKYGTMSLAQVVQPALEMAEKGYAVYPFQNYAIGHYLSTYQKWPENTRIFLRDGEAPPVGTVIRQGDLGRTFHRLMEAEKKAGSGGRAAGIRAARELFYRGDIARAMVDYTRRFGGLLSEADFATYEAKEERSFSLRFRGLELHACGPWCQGTVLPQALGILSNFNLASLGYNTPQYIHVLVEALKLAFADREAFCGDPEFVDVPMEGLLDTEYLRARASLIDVERAWPGVPPAGDPRRRLAVPSEDVAAASARAWEGTPPDSIRPTDTSCVTVLDSLGNLFSATPSDGYSQGGIVPGLGLGVSERGAQSHLDPDHPNALRPGKRPSLTPNPFLLLKDGKPFMAMASPGNNRQPQAMLQVLLNMFVWGMQPQAAVEAPRFASYSFPATTYPHVYYPGRLYLEKGIDEQVVPKLEELGHQIQWWTHWTWSAGGVCLSMRDPATGVVYGAADPRREGMAIGL